MWKNEDALSDVKAAGREQEGHGGAAEVEEEVRPAGGGGPEKFYNKDQFTGVKKNNDGMNPIKSRRTEAAWPVLSTEIKL